MDLLIEIPLNRCEHLPDISRYNHNYYRMPIMINYCKYILENYDGRDDFDGFELGEID